MPHFAITLLVTQILIVSQAFAIYIMETASARIQLVMLLLQKALASNCNSLPCTNNNDCFTGYCNPNSFVCSDKYCQTIPAPLSASNCNGL